MSNGGHSYGRYAKHNLYKDDKCVCALCGKTNGVVKSPDHIIPRALIKWSEHKDKIQPFIDSEDNVFYTHRDCNKRKDSIIHTIEDINKLHIALEYKIQLQKFLREHRDEVEAFNILINTCRVRQHNRCYICGTDISNKSVTIRRKIRQTGIINRNLDNAIVICSHCNMQHRISIIADRILENMLLERDGILASAPVFNKTKVNYRKGLIKRSDIKKMFNTVEVDKTKLMKR